MAPKKSETEKVLGINKKLFIGLVVLTLIISLGVFLLSKKRTEPLNQVPVPEPNISLKELIKEDSTIIISDTNVIKSIALDSIETGDRIWQSTINIYVPEVSTIDKLNVYQDEVLQEIKDQQARIERDKLPYSAGITSKSFTPITQLTGEVDMNDAENQALASYLASRPIQNYAYLSIGGRQLNPNDAQLDLRRLGIQMEIVDQNVDGFCWAFASCAAYEVSYQIKYRMSIKASEQYIIDCSGAGSADVGNAYKVFDWMVTKNKNLDRYREGSYTGVSHPCPNLTPATNYFASNWNLVLRNSPGSIATKESIKEAICRFGSIVASVFVTNDWRNYDDTKSNGIFLDRTDYRDDRNGLATNHSVLIIGWDDAKNAWLVKNSWGKGWGQTCGYGNDRGYMWIDYKSCNIGKRASWVVAR